MNFLENAVKYGPTGQTVTVVVRHATTGSGAGRVRLWVDDEGAGVPASERTAVWDAFYDDAPDGGARFVVARPGMMRARGDRTAHGPNGAMP